MTISKGWIGSDIATVYIVLNYHWNRVIPVNMTHILEFFQKIWVAGGTATKNFHCDLRSTGEIGFRQRRLPYLVRYLPNRHRPDPQISMFANGHVMCSFENHALADILINRQIRTESG